MSTIKLFPNTDFGDSKAEKLQNVAAPTDSALVVAVDPATGDYAIRDVTKDEEHVLFRPEQTTGVDYGSGGFTFDFADNGRKVNLTGGTFGDHLIGGAGNDILSGQAGDDVLFGSVGNNVLKGGAGNDTITYSNAVVALNVDLVNQTATHLQLDPATGKYKLYTDRLSSIEGVSVTAGNAVIFGDHKGNDLSGGFGTDIIQGRGGNDLLDAGDDLVFDSLDGGDGDDVLTGGVLDHLRGGDGNDRIGIDGASALIAGGEGVDTLIVAPDVTIAFGSDDAIYGIEKVAISRGASVDFSLIETSRGLDFVSRSAADKAVGITGTRHADTFRAGNGIDVFDGGDGIDTVSYAGSADRVVLDLETGTGRQGAHKDTLRDIENATGTHQDDILTGSDASNVLKGGAGNDILTAGRDYNVDSLYGGDGNDRLHGNVHDELRGGAGNDVLIIDGDSKLIDGGAGADTLVVQPAGKLIFFYNESKISGIEKIFVENDVRVSFADINTDHGLNITSRSTEGERTAIAGSKMDDVIKAGRGNDLLQGAAGDDKLFGNDERNSFLFNRGDGKDQVSHFDSGTDRLFFSGLASSMDDLTLTAVNRGQDTLITFAGQSAADQSVLLHDVRVAELTSTDFFFGA